MAMPNLRDIFQEHFEWRLNQWPEFATYVGFRNKQDELDDLSEQAVEKCKEYLEPFLKQLCGLDVASCSHADRLSHAVLVDHINRFLQGMPYKAYLMPINYSEGGPASFILFSNRMKCDSVQDYRDYLARLKAFPIQIMQIIDLMKTGLEEDIISYKKTVDDLPDRLETSINVDIMLSPYATHLINIPANIPENIRDSILTEGVAIIKDYIYPALKKLRNYLLQDYIPRARSNPAISSLPGGPAYYQELLNFFTETDMSVHELHDLGQRETKKWMNKIREIMEQDNFKDTPQKYYEYLMSQERFYCKTPEDLIAEIEKRMDKIKLKLPEYFNSVIDVPLRVERDIYVNASIALYRAPTEKISHGTLCIQMNNVKSIPLFQLMVLALHEGEPGHHLQAVHTMMNKEMPLFRQFKDDRRYTMAPGRFPLYSAITEGWGLYAEHLGMEMGLYEDKYDLLGYYKFELIRSSRIVVDTGIHALGWSYDEAVEYMSSHVILGLREIKNEVRRYISLPGQGCSYKIGQIKILELRSKAEKELGCNFDLKEFHDLCLKCGQIPLNLLEKEVVAWISEEKLKTRAK